MRRQLVFVHISGHSRADRRAVHISSSRRTFLPSMHMREALKQLAALLVAFGEHR
jgi:hypothetical protein